MSSVAVIFGTVNVPADDSSNLLSPVPVLIKNAPPESFKPTSHVIEPFVNAACPPVPLENVAVV